MPVAGPSWHLALASWHLYSDGVLRLRHVLRDIVLAGARRLGVNACVRTALAGRLLVLCYHAIIPDDFPVDPDRARVATRLGQFRRHLALLKRRFTPVSADDVIAHLRIGQTLPPRSALITFDDGFRNNLLAADELERAGVPALLLLATDYIGTDTLLWTQELDERILAWPGDKLPMPAGLSDADLPPAGQARWPIAHRVRDRCKRLTLGDRSAYLSRLRQAPMLDLAPWQRELYRFLSWDEVRSLASRGWAIGSHTATHTVLTAMSPTELAEELRTSKARIESELGRPCEWLAYPNGHRPDFSPAAEQAAREAGYSAALAMTGRANPRSLDPFAIDRVCIPGDLSDDGLHARLSGLRTVLPESA
jgi:peptidoglycan/xylan/chitin deacetylase (PgdA/CDA1 family)